MDAYGRMAQRQQLLRAVTSRNKDIAFHHTSINCWNAHNTSTDVSVGRY
jgi:hypothetical protein